jgi:hypothetical protein
VSSGDASELWRWRSLRGLRGAIVSCVVSHSNARLCLFRLNEFVYRRYCYGCEVALSRPSTAPDAGPGPGPAPLKHLQASDDQQRDAASAASAQGRKIDAAVQREASLRLGAIPSVQVYGSGNQSIKHNGRTRENHAVLLLGARPTDTDTRLRLTVH